MLGPAVAQWGLLLVASAVLGAALEWVRLPAALLLGPMLAGILLESAGGTVRVPRLPYLGAQALIGCLVARAITPAILSTFSQRWPLFLAVVLAIVLASSALGYTLSRLRVLPGTTAIWGLLPGAASVMMVMAEAFGADGRLVAFMQYLRLVLVAGAASTIARFWLGAPSGVVQPAAWFPALSALPFAETLVLALVGGAVGYASRLPAGVLLVPMVAGAVLRGSGVLTITLPPWLLALSYACLGWTIGLGFTREVLAHALRALPQTVLSIVLLMAFCAGLAGVLVHTLQIDPLTAYLATSPGGLDAVAIIAATSKVDVPFVMSLQTMRFVCVLLFGPPLSRWLARRVAGRDAERAPSVDSR